MKQSEKLLVFAVGVFLLGLLMMHTGFYLIHYLVGRGWLGFSCIFLVMPTFLVLVPLLTVLLARRLNRASNRIGFVGLILLCIGSLLLTFFLGPSWKTGDEYLCLGLKHQIHAKESEHLLMDYSQKLLAETPEGTTNGKVIRDSPDWLKQMFKKTIRVEVYNKELKFIRIVTGGGLLRYGICVGMTASDLSSLHNNSGSIFSNVNSNIVVFAE
jgi:hypothetical protein